MTVTILATIGGYAIARAAIAIILHLFFDRSGNSGRMTHWSRDE